jgi:tetratricopeptide (TPR) repeat protein
VSLPLLPRINSQCLRNDPGLFLIVPPSVFRRAWRAFASPALALVLLGSAAALAAPLLVSPGSSSAAPGSTTPAPSADSGGSTTALRQLADQRFAAGAINGAIQIWSGLIAANRDLEPCLYNRAQAYLILAQLPLAQLDLDRLVILQRQRPSSSTFLLRGILNNELGNPNQALADFERALKIDANPLVYANRALAYQRMGQLDRAEADLQLAVRQDPSASNLHNLAVVQRQLGRPEACINNASLVIRAKPTFAPAYTVRGLCLYELRRYPEAIADFLRSTTINPVQAEAHHYLGLSMVALGRAAEANPVLLRAADLYLAERNQQGYQAVMQQLASPSPQAGPR